MRISETKVFQLIEREPELENQYVILDEVTGEEMVLTPEEVRNVYKGIDYFTMFG